jgi:hypothetical protein
MKQIDRVLRQLKKEGTVSRNYYLDLPYGEKITRLGAIINRLKVQGYTITGYEDGHDFKYRLDLDKDGTIPVRVEYEKVVKNGELVVIRREIPLHIGTEAPIMPYNASLPL